MTDLESSTVPVQQEAIQFNNPVSESSLAAIGAVANFLLKVQPPVGTIWASMLTETQFQSLINDPSPATWILADGRSVAGSAYAFATGQTNAPDLRGIFLRGLNNGGSAAGTRSDAFANPDDLSGTFTPGTLTQDKFKSHTHTYSVNSSFGADTTSAGGNAGEANGNPLTSATGGNETAPKNASINWFIRIN